MHLPDTLKIARVLRYDDIGVREGDTVADVLAAGGKLIDHSIDAPLAVFQTEDGQWLVASVELVLNEADPVYVQELLEEDE